MEAITKRFRCLLPTAIWSRQAKSGVIYVQLSHLDDATGKVSYGIFRMVTNGVATSADHIPDFDTEVRRLEHE